MPHASMTVGSNPLMANNDNNRLLEEINQHASAIIEVAKKHNSVH